MKYIKRSGVIAMLILTGLFLPKSMTVGATGTQDNPVAGNATFQTTQQQKFVSGNVTDAETQEPLIGVSIKIKGTNIATVTDANGHYQIQLRTSQDILIFTYIGKKTVEIRTNGRARLDVVMENDETEKSRFNGFCCHCQSSRYCQRKLGQCHERPPRENGWRTDYNQRRQSC